MARKRTTLEVETIKAKANAALAGDYGDAGYRAGIASLLETVLHATGQYKGFNHLGWMNGGCDAWRAAGEPKDNAPFIGDESRRYYY